MTNATADGRYIVISADCHAGGSHAQYRDYLEERWRDEFDAWRGRYKNPFKDLRDDSRIRNWDNDRRNAELDADGVAGEVIFPNTVPPFFPTMSVLAPQPTADDYQRRLAGIRAHNRWLADWCSAYPERRAGIGQIFLNNVDDAIEDVRWIAEHNLRGGILLPTVPPDITWIKPLYHADYEPLWQACQELDVVINTHGGSGAPAYGKHPAALSLLLAEGPFFSHRPLVHMILGGVFEKFPGLRFVLTEQGGAWIPPLLDKLDADHARMRTGHYGEFETSPEQVLPQPPSYYFQRNVWVGVSFPKREDAAARERIGVDRFMWGSDYPHHEGTYPYSREHLRQIFSDLDEAEMTQMLAGNAAKVYDFDLGKLATIAAKIGPTVEELRQPLETVPADATSPAFFS